MVEHWRQTDDTEVTDIFEENLQENEKREEEARREQRRKGDRKENLEASARKILATVLLEISYKKGTTEKIEHSSKQRVIEAISKIGMVHQGAFKGAYENLGKNLRYEMLKGTMRAASSSYQRIDKPNEEEDERRTTWTHRIRVESGDLITSVKELIRELKSNKDIQGRKDG